MRNLIKKVLKESIGGNYFYLITTKDDKYYLNEGSDTFDAKHELVPLDGTLDYDELDRLHQPGHGGDNLYQSRERAESSLKSKIKWYEKIRTEMGDENYQQDAFFDTPRRDLINQMKELGYTWDDLVVKEYYLGLIPATTSI
jgi:hypothetical protein